jgi:hypothetical protein
MILEERMLLFLLNEEEKMLLLDWIGVCLHKTHEPLEQNSRHPPTPIHAINMNNQPNQPTASKKTSQSPTRSSS